MIFTNIRDLKYVTENNSHIDLFATCEEFGEIPMTINLADTEDLHVYFDGITEYPLEEYCKTQDIAEYIAPEPIIVVPNSITMRQARLYLLSIGKLDDVELLVQDNKAWQIEWEYANEVLRSNQLITALQEALELSDTDVDNIFIEASKL